MFNGFLKLICNMFYLVRTPNWVQKVYNNRIWKINSAENELFLSFDDGPHPEHTPFVLDELKKHNAKATFFCIGKNVLLYPEVYRRIIEEGHSVGNHTNNHLNAGKTGDKKYLENIKLAKQYIDSSIFRPPYGRVSGFLVKQLKTPFYNLKTVMWTVLSADFDPKISKEQCLNNVLLNAAKGSIIVFHDSEKASERMRYALPQVLEYFSKKGYYFSKINSGE
jgi:peptidoglycan-N-acetylglucosamine deacetylase